MTTDADVIVVGAGLAGAAAALWLSQRGLSVRILEARDRIGGRGYARRFAADGDVLDFGGAWITPWQHRIRRLCREHGVALRPRAPVLERRWFRDGALHRDGPTSARDRPAHERALARLAADAILLKMGHERDERDRSLVDVSFADYLTRIQAPPATRDLLSAWWTVSGNADKRLAPASELLASSAYGDGLTEAMIEFWTDSLEGGVSALAERMIGASGAATECACPVGSVAASDGDVTLHAAAGRFKARAAILATGLNPLRHIAFDPPLPAERQAAVKAGHLGCAVKVWVKARNVPLGVLATGGGSGIEWMLSERLATDGATMLVGFGVAADGPPDLPGDAVAAARRFFPEAEIVAVDWHDWNADPFSLGAWVAGRIGTAGAIAHTTWSPCGALAFAGSDIAVDQAGWFEAAVISGETAAQETLNYLRRA